MSKCDCIECSDHKFAVAWRKMRDEHNKTVVALCEAVLKIAELDKDHLSTK